MAPAKLQRFVSIDEDLGEAGMRKFLPSRAEYYRSYLCRSCSLYVVDYGTVLVSKEAKALAPSMA